jgi:hypothetical protein
MDLEQPKPHKNPNWVPVIVYKNGKPLKEFSNIQETFRYFRPLLNVPNKSIYNFITAGVFELLPYKLNDDIFEFRTYEERRKQHFEEIKYNKQSGRKGR